MLLDGYWKKELKVQSFVLKHNRSFSLIPQLHEHLVNRAILLTAVIARKIIEDEKWAEKESKNGDQSWYFKSNLLGISIPIMIFPYHGEQLPPGPVDPTHYGKGERSMEPSEYIINSIIHSFYWILIGYPRTSTIEAFCVSSDRHKDQLYYVKLTDWISFLQTVYDYCHI